jgi:hypothetical protein
MTRIFLPPAGEETGEGRDVMIKTHVVTLGCVSVVAVLVAGCAIGPTRLEADYGNSYTAARDNQILDLLAAQNLEPVYGFDAEAAANTLERYRAGFAKPPAPPTFVLSVGQR